MEYRIRQDTDVRLHELAAKRRMLEEQLNVRSVTLAELKEVRQESCERLSAAIEEQNGRARLRNQALREEMASATLDNARTARANLALKPQSLDRLKLAKEQYLKHLDAALPVWHRYQAIHLQQKVNDIKVEKEQSMKRREQLKLELVKENEIKHELERHRQELLLSLAAEQHNVLEANAAAVLLEEEGRAVDKRIIQQLASATADMRDLVSHNVQRMREEIDSPVVQSDVPAHMRASYRPPNTTELQMRQMAHRAQMAQAEKQGVGYALPPALQVQAQAQSQVQTQGQTQGGSPSKVNSLLSADPRIDAYGCVVDEGDEYGDGYGQPAAMAYTPRSRSSSSTVYAAPPMPSPAERPSDVRNPADLSDEEDRRRGRGGSNASDNTGTGTAPISPGRSVRSDKSTSDSLATSATDMALHMDVARAAEVLGRLCAAAEMRAAPLASLYQNLSGYPQATKLLHLARSGNGLEMEILKTPDAALCAAIISLVRGKSAVLIPAEAFSGVVSLEKLKKEYKRVGLGAGVLWDKLAAHLCRIVAGHNASLAPLTEAFTSALMATTEGDGRLTRKVSSLLQLALIPPDQERSPSPPYRARDDSKSSPKFSPSPAPLVGAGMEVGGKGGMDSWRGYGSPKAIATEIAGNSWNAGRDGGSGGSGSSRKYPGKRAAELDEDEFEEEEAIYQPPPLRDLDGDNDSDRLSMGGGGWDGGRERPQTRSEQDGEGDRGRDGKDDEFDF
ncbi:hypothetical protein B484DRAFT_477606 [Ochromonadaceae sp. CCMP2298]|nr:hypothetical protein B484DRAFT_477606 [Ochromonadaceae sp. CCMP2298]